MGLPWYAFYPGDYARDTADLSLMDHGAYRLLLDFYYSNCDNSGGFLPLSFESNCRICKAYSPEEKKTVKKIINKYFVRNGNKYFHSRADLEIQKQVEKHTKASQKAAAAANAKWEKHRK